LDAAGLVTQVIPAVQVTPVAAVEEALVAAYFKDTLLVAVVLLLIFRGRAGRGALAEVARRGVHQLVLPQIMAVVTPDLMVVAAVAALPVMRDLRVPPRPL
jgi:hypothetical protein